MALLADTVWEVRTTGLDTNGGGFTTSGSGTDWSQQTSPQYAVTNGVTNGSTTITSATAAFGTDVVGNIMYVQGGTGSIVAGWYRIVSRTSATAVVVDRTTGLTAGTGVTLRIGGALLTISKVAALMTLNGMKAWVKSGSYSQSAGVTFPASVLATNLMAIEGYTTTRGDRSTRPVLFASGSMSAMVTFPSTSSGIWLVNIEVDGNNVATVGLQSLCTNGGASECIFRRCADAGVYLGSQGSSLIYSEVTTCAGGSSLAAGVFSGGTSGVIWGNKIHANTTSGITLSASSAAIINNLIVNNSLYAINNTSSPFAAIVNNTISGNGGGGISVSSAGSLVGIIGNILSFNTGYGLVITGTSVIPSPIAAMDRNAYYSNSSGSRFASTFVGSHDVTLTADPYTDKANGDFSLNTAVGGGAACRAAGLGTFPGTAVLTGYADIGAVQHRDPSKPDALFLNPGSNL